MAGNKKTPPGQPTAPTPSGGSQLTLEQLLQQSNNIAAQALTGVGGTSGKITDTSQIYMGTYTSPTNSFENNLSYAQARLLPRDWMESDPEKLKTLVNAGIMGKVPGFSVGMGLPDILSAWDDLVQSSYALNQNLKEGQKKWTPWDVLDTYGNAKGSFGTVKKGDWLYDVATGEKIKYVGPRSKTTTSRDVNLSSAEDVKALTTQILTQALGRAPTAKEVAQYKATINAQEEANPTVTTTTQTLDDQGQVASQSSKSTGGFDAAAQQQMVQDQVIGTPEFAKYQSGTTYWNALMSMLTGG